MARIRFVLFMLVLSSLGVKVQQAEKYLSHPLPAGWQEQDAMFQQALPVDDHWWTVFQDATLDSLIHVAVRQNPSVLTALNRIDMAKANLRIARGGYYPALSLDAGWNRQQTSGNTGTGQPQSRVGYYDATVNMSWQVDVFGSIRQRVKAQKGVIIPDWLPNWMWLRLNRFIIVHWLLFLLQNPVLFNI